LRGLTAKIHSLTENIVHLELYDIFKEELIDLRDYLKQSSIVSTLKMNQWICCDESFCGFFGCLTNLKISLKNFSFMKRMKYPNTLKVLDVQLEALTKAFLDGIRKNAPSLEEMIITFSRVDETVVETLNSFQLEMK
jgi:hypothetical protein